MCPFCQPYRVKKTSSKQSKRHDLHLKWVKEAIYIRLHPNNINRDSGIEIPEAWMLTIKKHNRRMVQQRTTEGTATHRKNGTIGGLKCTNHSQPL